MLQNRQVNADLNIVNRVDINIDSYFICINSECQTNKDLNDNCECEQFCNEFMEDLVNCNRCNYCNQSIKSCCEK